MIMINKDFPENVTYTKNILKIFEIISLKRGICEECNVETYYLFGGVCNKCITFDNYISNIETINDIIFNTDNIVDFLRTFDSSWMPFMKLL